VPRKQRKSLATAVLSLVVLGGTAVPVSSQSPLTPPGAAGSRADSAPSLAPVSRAIDPPSLPGALAPRWASTAQGPLLTWLEPWTAPAPKPSAGKGKGYRLRAARWKGDRWSEPVTLAEGTRFFANWADTPGAIEGPDGTLYAHWLETTGPETHDYGIQLARSEDGGTTWRPLGALHRDGAMGEHGFVSWVRDGAWVRAFWVDGRDMTMKGEQQIGAMALRSALVGEVAEGDVRLDGRICDCCQTAAALAAEGPLVVYRDRSAKEIRDIKLVRRTAAGWSEPIVVGADEWEISGCPVNGPVVAAAGREVAVAWFTGAAPTVRVQVAFSHDGGASFDKPMVLDDGTPIGRVDIALDADGSAIVSWYAFAGEGAALQLRRAHPEGRLGPTATLATTTPGRSSGFPRLLRAKDQLLLVWVGEGSPQHLRAAALPAAAVR
jgi:hypothetical protein